MDSRDGNVQQNHPTLCKNGCGFYSNAGNEGLCSVCYKDIVKKKQAPPTNMPASFSKCKLVQLYKMSHLSFYKKLMAKVFSCPGPPRTTATPPSTGSLPPTLSLEVRDLLNISEQN